MLVQFVRTQLPYESELLLKGLVVFTAVDNCRLPQFLALEFGVVFFCLVDDEVFAGVDMLSLMLNK